MVLEMESLSSDYLPHSNGRPVGQEQVAHTAQLPLLDMYHFYPKIHHSYPNGLKKDLDLESTIHFVSPPELKTREQYRTYHFHERQRQG